MVETIYALVASFLSTIGGYDFSFSGFLISFLYLFLALYLSKRIFKLFEEKNDFILPVVSALIFNIFMFLLSDKKDIQVLIAIQIVWFLSSAVGYFIRKNILKCDYAVFLHEFINWYLPLVIFIVMEGITNLTPLYMYVSADIFNFIVSIYFWRVLSLIPGVDKFIIQRKVL